MTNNSIKTIDNDKLWLLEFLRDCTIHYEPTNSSVAKDIAEGIRKAFDDAVKKSGLTHSNNCSENPDVHNL